MPRLLHRALAGALLLAGGGCKRGDTGALTASPPTTDSAAPADSEPPAPAEPCAGLDLTGPAGAIYVDGVYSGASAPGPLALSPGVHRVAIGADSYFARDVTIEADGLTCALELGEADQVAPRTWRALYVDIPSLRGVENACEVSASQAELDAVYGLFASNMNELSQVAAYQTITWEITRVSTSGTVEVDGGAGNYQLEPADLGSVFDDLEIGEYDLIATGWKAEGDGCVLDAWYVGLGWTPQDATRQMGFANLRLQSPDLVSYVEQARNSDPGGFLHEWLHTVEVHFGDIGAEMPTPAGGFPLHAAEDYGYSYPWLDWYADFMREQVPDEDGSGFLGITPEKLMSCTLSDVALDPGACD